ncbi:polysaccharide deacetylase family protein, partial [Nanoarchaeota archaeon]
MKRDLKKINIIAGLFVFLLVFLFVLYAFRYDGKMDVLLSFDVEIIDGVEVEEILDILDRQEVVGTFFIVGEYAEKNPSVIRRIADRHEVACHTYSHVKMTKISDLEKREELVKCREVLEEISGAKVGGFRAPWHALDLKTLLILEEEGFLYDASVPEGLGWMYPSVADVGIGEVPVSTFLMV